MALDPLYPDVGFYGLPGAGKSTAAIFLERLGYRRLPVAGYHRGGVRDIALRLWGTGADADREKLDALARLREIDPMVWTRNWEREYLVAKGEHRAVVNDDLRGRTEWYVMRGRGFVLVHVEAPYELRVDRLRRSGKLQSEEALAWDFHSVLEDSNLYHPDYVVSNAGSEDELFAAVTDILNIERGKRA